MNHAEEESPMEQTGEYIVVNGPEDLKGLDLDDGTYDEMDEDAMDAGSLGESAVPATSEAGHGDEAADNGCADQQEGITEPEKNQRPTTRDIRDLLSVQHASSSYIASRNLPFSSQGFIDELISELRNLQRKIDALSDSWEGRLAPHLVAIREQIQNNTKFLLGGDVISPELLPDQAALGITLLNAAYHEQTAHRFSVEISRLNQIISCWQVDVYMSRVAHRINYDAAQQGHDILLRAIENDPRLEQPITDLVTAISLNQNIVASEGWKILRDVARKNTRELLHVTGLGVVTYGNIREYFRSRNLPHLSFVPKEKEDHFNYSYNPVMGWYPKYLREIVASDYSWKVPNHYSSRGKTTATLRGNSSCLSVVDDAQS